MNRDGSGVTQMFEGQMRQLLNADYAPMHLIDVLEGDPENVLFGTWGAEWLRDLSRQREHRPRHSG